MDKKIWCETNFADELADCLPLPDSGAKEASRWRVQTLSLEVVPDFSVIAAGTLFLLGIYGCVEEAGLLVRDRNKWFPLRLHWDIETPPKLLVEMVEKMAKEAGTFSWTRQDAWETLGQELGRGIALSLVDSLPKGEREGFVLIFQVEDDGLSVSYAASCYTEAFIRTLLLSWWEVILTFQKAETLSMISVTADETMGLLDSFNKTERDYDRNATIIHQFCARAAEMPDNVAVVYEDRSYTYGEVDDLSDKLAYWILQQGLGRGDTVSVFIPRSEYMVIASLGVLKAGCAYEPLDPNYPDERLSFMVKDAQAKLMLVADSLLPRLENFKEFSGKWLRISEIVNLPQPVAETRRGIQLPQPEDLFTLIYTSGTTGVPKGVRLLHRNLMAYAAWYRRFFVPTSESRITCYNSYGFDGSLTDIYPALTVGAAVVVIPEEKKLDLPALADIIRQHGVTIADLPSQVGRQFSLTMDCPSLKYVVGGGEKLVPFTPVYPYIFSNEYGPTETTIAITCYNMTEYEADVPIGKPMDNTAIYIVDKLGHRVPPGALGELWVAGEQISGGYLNRPEKTREVFLPNPFSQKMHYETVYRTGDIVRYRLDGNIEYIGRRDGLVKIRGFRVELAEVEGVIRDFPPVKNAVVIACDNPAGGKFIAAYVVAEKPIDKKLLSSFIRERKPPYMVPAVIIQIDDIPRNQNGKLNRKALPIPEIHGVHGEYVPPKNETEAELAKGFAVALGLERVSAEEDFFEAGGDSLSLVQLLSECRRLRLNFQMVYEGKTPVGIARLLAQREHNKTGHREGRKTHFFGPLQELHYQWGNELEEGYGVHCDATVHLAPETDLERLAAAVEAALRAHSAVDARLSVTADEVLRWCSGDGKDFKPQIVNISRKEYDILRSKLRKPMNRPETRMFYTGLFAVTEEDGSVSKDFYFDFLHPITDGDSIDIFLTDIDKAYGGAPVEPEEFSIFDYYDEIEDSMKSDAYRQRQQWNRDFVHSFTERLCELPGDLDAKGENETKAVVLPVHAELAMVDRFTRDNGITDGTLCSAAFGLLQGHNNGEQAGVILTLYNGRDDSRFERTMGAVYRHYPLCVRWSDKMTAREFLRQTQENIMLCRRHALYEGDPVPLITSFAYQGDDLEDDFEFCGGKAIYDEVEDFEEENFNFYVYRKKDDFYAYLTYNTKEYSNAFVSRFMENYSRALRGLIDEKSPSEIVKGFDKNTKKEASV